MCALRAIATTRCRSVATARSLLTVYQDTDNSSWNSNAGLFKDPFGDPALGWVNANGIETVCNWAIRMGGLDAPELAPLRPVRSPPFPAAEGPAACLNGAAALSGCGGC